MLRLTVRVRRADSELALAELLDLAPNGVEERELDEVVEYAVYGAPGELPMLPDLQAAVGGALVEVSTSEVPDGWDKRWRDFHRPLVLGGASDGSVKPGRGARLVVRPPWELPLGAQIELVIDPGQAFGTGAHATTRLCLELLLDLDPGGALLDLGCGSGVLAIAAAGLGFSPVLALDNDPASVEAARSNAAVNGVELDVRRGDLRRDPAPRAPTVVANLLRPLLLDYAGSLREPPQRLIASGLLAPEADEVAAAFAAHGLYERARRLGGEWAALLLTSG